MVLMVEVEVEVVFVFVLVAYDNSRGGEGPEGGDESAAHRLRGHQPPSPRLPCPREGGSFTINALHQPLTLSINPATTTTTQTTFQHSRTPAAAADQKKNPTGMYTSHHITSPAASSPTLIPPRITTGTGTTHQPYTNTPADPSHTYTHTHITSSYPTLPLCPQQQQISALTHPSRRMSNHPHQAGKPWAHFHLFLLIPVIRRINVSSPTTPPSPHTAGDNNSPRTCTHAHALASPVNIGRYAGGGGGGGGGLRITDIGRLMFIL